MSDGIIRGTTPTVTFYCDFDTTTIGAETIIEITFAQGGVVLFTKDESDTTIDYEANALSVTLTEDDTLAFDENRDIQMQIRLKFDDAEVIASDIMITDAKRLLQNKKISEEEEGGV